MTHHFGIYTKEINEKMVTISNTFDNWCPLTVADDGELVHSIRDFFKSQFAKIARIYYSIYKGKNLNNLDDFVETFHQKTDILVKDLIAIGILAGWTTKTLNHRFGEENVKAVYGIRRNAIETELNRVNRNKREELKEEYFKNLKKFLEENKEKRQEEMALSREINKINKRGVEVSDILKNQYRSLYDELSNGRTAIWNDYQKKLSEFPII